MRFNSETGSKAGKVSKRGTALPISLRGGLHQLVSRILNDLDYDSLTNNQRLKLLDIALKHSLPRLSVEKQIAEDELPKEFEINIINGDGKVIETHTTLMDNKG